MRNGETIWHGNDVPYVVPSPSYLLYIQSHVRRAIDAGITEIFLEEPEYWARAGYSESFKKEWQKYYHTPWVPQHESPEATYLSSKLKYQLYFNALKQVFQYAKSYGVSKGLQVKWMMLHQIHIWLPPGKLFHNRKQWKSTPEVLTHFFQTQTRIGRHLLSRICGYNKPELVKWDLPMLQRSPGLQVLKRD